MKHNTPLIFVLLTLLVISCSKNTSLDSTVPSVRIASVTSDGGQTLTVIAEVDENALTVKSCGFYCSGNISFADSDKYSSRLTGNSFAADISLAQTNKTYYICAYVSNGNSEICSEAVPVKATESANCYIVSKVGKYKFRTVKGNSGTSVGSVASCEVLWESFGTATTPSVGDLIRSVSYSDGYIAFETATTFREGNAVIAAKDASGNILWSWHIWLTDQPKGQTYNNGAGVTMDRNLGATSATPGDVGALGLLYQWGRKDPFLGSSSISSNTEAESTITWPSSVSSSSSTGTIAYATAHPTTFITGNDYSYWDWEYSSNNTRWRSSKTIYDPCPAGWRVPEGGRSGVWAKAFGTISDWETSTNWDSSNYGMDFSKTDKKLGTSGPIWYPASGCRYGSGSLNFVGSIGDYWSASPYDNKAYFLSIYDDGYVFPVIITDRARGQSVRCIQE